MARQRVKTREPDGTETVVYLEALIPLDGHGGRLRQRYLVLDREHERLGTVTRHRNDYGTTTHWTATGLDARTRDHHSRGAAIFDLMDQH